MLTTFLAVATLGVVLQTDETAERPEVTESDPKAITFIEEAEGLIHRPEEHGLESLSFQYDMNAPGVGRLGTVKVSWTKGTDGTIDAEPNEEVLPNLAMMGMDTEVLTAQMESNGRELLALQLGLMQDRILEQAYVSLEGAEDDMVQIRCHPREDSELSFVEDLVLSFDPEGLMKEMRMAMTQQGMTIKRSERFDWKDAGGGSYVLATRVAENEMPNPMGAGSMTMTETTTHQHAAVGDLMLVTGFTTQIDAPMPGMGGEQTTTFKDLTVNGEPVEG